jgi:hypothetical protein
MFNCSKHFLVTRSVWHQPNPFACSPIQTNLRTVYVFYNSTPLSLSKPMRDKNLLRNAWFWRIPSIRVEEKLQGSSGGEKICVQLKVCGPCIIVYQCSESNVMYFLFSLRIKGLYMFRALVAHLQEALHKRHFVYCMRVMSVGCTRIGVNSNPAANWHNTQTPIFVYPSDITRTQHTKRCLCISSWGWASNARNV